MTGQEAIEKLEQGCSMRRESWVPGCFIKLEGEAFNSFHHSRYTHEFTIDYTDYTATDWVEHKLPEVKRKLQWLDKLPEKEGYYQAWSPVPTFHEGNATIVRVWNNGKRWVVSYFGSSTIDLNDLRFENYKWLPLELASPPE
jgi:hypothetical protein